MSYTLETLYEIWDDKTGNKIEVGPDRDALDLIEIRAIDDGKRVSDVTLTREQAALVSNALQALLEQDDE